MEHGSEHGTEIGRDQVVGRRRRGAAWLGCHRVGPVPRPAVPPALALALLAVLAVLTVLAVLPSSAVLAVPSTAASAVPPAVGMRSDAASGPTHRTAVRSTVRWSWPTTTRVVVRPWEAPATDYGPGHRGLDVPARPGTPVTAPADGTVAFAGQVGGREVVTIDHGGGLVSTLDPVVPSVPAGALVRRGDRVGTVGDGRCPVTAPCLHLGARVDGRYFDPLPLLPRPAWPVLLPDDQARG